MSDPRLSELQTLRASFSRVVLGLEHRFVPLGDALGQAISQLGTLATDAEQRLDGLRTELERGALGELKERSEERVRRLESLIAQVGEQLEPLRVITHDLGRLRTLASELDHIAIFVGVCRCNFAIEIARSAGSERTFASFVTDIRSLADTLRALTERIADNCATTKAQLERAHRTIQRDLDDLKRLTRAASALLTKAATDVLHIVEQTRNAVAAVETHRAALVERRNSMVYYLQFGDLIRQKCEHVTAALEDAERLWPASGANDPEAFGAAVNVLSTQSAQLELVERELVDAAAQLGDQCTGSADDLNQLRAASNTLRELALVSQAERSSCGALRNRLLELDLTQTKALALGAHANQTADGARDAVNAFQEQFKGVQQVSSKLHRLALNATIHTSRHNQSDALFALSTQLDTLHEACGRVAQEVTLVLGSISDQLAQLTSAPRNVDGASVAESIVQLEHVKKLSTDGCQELSGAAQQAEKHLGCARQRLRAVRALSTEVSGHRQVLDALLSALPEVNHLAIDATLRGRLEARYTMESEREAHRGAGNDKRYPARNPALSKQSEHAAQEVELGDNVELF